MFCNPDAALTTVIHVDLHALRESYKEKNGSRMLQVYQVLLFKFSKKDLNISTGMTICIIFPLQD